MNRNARHAAAAVFALLAVLLAACGREQPAEEPKTPAPPAAESAPAPAPPAEPPPPAAETAPAATDSVTGFHGFGPAKFGDGEESVRIAWGRPMVFNPEPSADVTCTYLMPDPQPAQPLRIAFMFENGRFVRYDVDGDSYEAPGSARVGNTVEALHTLYAGRYEEQPHKYVEGGRYLIVSGPDGSEAKLVFEIDAEGTVTRWRLGLPPQVHYVEGCS